MGHWLHAPGIRWPPAARRRLVQYSDEPDSNQRGERDHFASRRRSELLSLIQAIESFRRGHFCPQQARYFSNRDSVGEKECPSLSRVHLNFGNAVRGCQPIFSSSSGLALPYLEPRFRTNPEGFRNKAQRLRGTSYPG